MWTGGPDDKIGLGLARDFYLAGDGFLKRFKWGQGGQFELFWIAPIAQRLGHLFDGSFWIDRSDQRDHHALRTVAALVEIHQVIPLDGPDGFRPAVIRAGIRMTFKDDLVEGDRSHVGRILGALGQTGQELSPQPFNLFGWENRVAQDICQQMQA